jgi:Porin subfamily
MVMRGIEYRSRRGASKTSASKETLTRGGARIYVVERRSGENGPQREEQGIKLMNPRILLVTAAALALVVAPALAQTLTQPNPAVETKPSPPSGTTKSRHTGHVKTCDAYGAGFRNIPGTDACIKIGGSVTVDVGR